MSLKVNRLTNANIYVDGNSFLGRAEEITLPDIKHKMADHKGLGMVGTVELFSGIDKMECKIKWNSFYSEVMKKAANPTQAVQLQCRGSVEEYGAAGRTAERPVVCYVTGMFKNVPAGNFKQHDNVELESMLTVTYVKVEYDGAAIYEIDVLANIYKVDGEDILANYRQNLGI